MKPKNDADDIFASASVAAAVALDVFVVVVAVANGNALLPYAMSLQI